MEMKSVTSFLFFLLAILNILNLSTAQFPTERVHICRNTGNYTTRSDYSRNLKTALNQVGMVKKLNGHFYNSSWGGNEAAYALALCSSVATRWGADCTDCVTKLSNNLSILLCPDQKEAIIWGSNCMVRYSDRKIFGVLDDWGMNLLPERDVAADRPGFDKALTEMATRLQMEASRGGDRKAALGTTTYPPHGITVYGAMQCTPDLSADLCIKCIRKIITSHQTCCSGKTAARMFSPNCYFTYSLKEFSNWKP